MFDELTLEECLALAMQYVNKGVPLPAELHKRIETGEKQETAS